MGPKPGEQIQSAVRFTVPGKPVGYYAVGARPNCKRMNEYHAYLQHVRFHALHANVTLPLKASERYPIRINTVAYFADRRHADPENIRKGISDSLFYVSKADRAMRKALRLPAPTGDKYCFGSFEPPRYDAKNPRVEVEIVFSHTD